MAKNNIYCEEVIISTLTSRGKGVEADPVRRITEVYDKAGNLIAEKDPIGGYSKYDIISFCQWCAIKNPDSQINERALTDWLDTFKR